LGDKKT